MASARISYERSEYVNDARLAGILAFSRTKYGDNATVSKYQRNWWLNRPGAEHFEINAECHPSCKWETLATVRYRGKWEAVVAQATCGYLGVWRD